MTTIAYRDGVLASDSRLTYEDNISTDKCKKIWRLKDGSLYGFSGENEPGLRLLDALNSDATVSLDLPDDSEFTAIRILPKGQIYWNEGQRWCRWPEKFCAIGSGGKFAKVAMHWGATAVAAVKTGITNDIYSGGHVQQLTLKRTKH